MNATKITLGAALSLALLVGVGRAQDGVREREVAELEAMLKRVEAALAELEPLAAPEVILAQYDVRHLMHQPEDRFAPSLWVPSEAAGFRAGAGAAGSFSFDSEEEYESTVLDPDRLESHLIEVVGEDEWDEPRSIEVHRGFLFVRQTALNHARIRRLLDTLTERAVRAVQLEVGFYALPLALEDQVRADALANRGVLSRQVLDRIEAAVRDGGARQVGSSTLTALDEQRVYLHQGTERAYVADYERASGGTGQITETVPDPIVEVLLTGLALEVRPTVVDAHGDDAHVALDVRFARSRPLAFVERKTPWGPVTMPQVTMDSVRTSAQVPAGSGVLVFGARGTEDDGTTDVVIVVRPRVIGR